MAQEIPIFLTTSSDFTEELELGGQIATLRIKWNVRNDCPHLDFTDTAGDSVYGVKIVPYWPLLRQIKGSIDFNGDLMVLKDDQNTVQDITYENFGNGQNLYYLTPDEVNFWEETNGSL